MKKVFILIAVALLAFGLVVPRAFAAGNMNFFLGAKALDENDWEPIDSHSEFGIMLDFGGEEWPVNLAVDLMVSSTEETATIPPFGSVEVKAATTELDLGVRKAFDIGSMHPFIGGGIGFMAGAYEVGGLFECDGSGTGGWVDAGIYWTLAESFNIGFDARSSSADVEFTCTGGGSAGDLNVGGTHFGLILGYHW